MNERENHALRAATELEYIYEDLKYHKDNKELEDIVLSCLEVLREKFPLVKDRLDNKVI